MYPNLIKEARKKGFTQKDLARELGISYKALYNKLTGKCQFTWQEVKTIRWSFFPNLDYDYLFFVE